VISATVRTGPFVSNVARARGMARARVYNVMELTEPHSRILALDLGKRRIGLASAIRWASPRRPSQPRPHNKRAIWMRSSGWRAIARPARS